MPHAASKYLSMTGCCHSVKNSDDLEMQRAITVGMIDLYAPYAKTPIISQGEFCHLRFSISGGALSECDINSENDPVPDAVTPSRAAKGRRFLLIIGILVLAPAIVGAKSGWMRFQTHRFHAACETARSQKDWRSERSLADQWVAWDPDRKSVV